MATLEDFQKYVAAGLNDDDDGGTGGSGPSWKYPHAFHLNLPPHHLDEADGIPYITKYAYKKARYVMKVLEALELTPQMLLQQDSNDNGNNTDNKSDQMEIDGATTDANVEPADDDQDEEDEIVDSTQSVPKPTTMPALLLLCSRLQSQLSGLESLKHCGLSRLELSHIVLKVLRLVTATYTIETNPETRERTVEIHYEKVGYIYDGKSEKEVVELEADSASLEEAVSSSGHPFVIPSPGREVLLSLVINVLSNKGPLRSVSNAAVFPKQENDGSGGLNPPASRFLLVLHWRTLLRMLLRTAPYLDERKVGLAPTSSNSRVNTIVKRSVQMIRDARHFFDQGLNPSSLKEDGTQACDDTTARQVWDMVKTDVMFHSHTHASYRSLVMLYLFQPSRCTSAYYIEMMTLWFDSWSNVDRCPEVDFLWLALFTRARKHLPPQYDWGPIRRRLLTHSLYWLQLPIGGGTLDKSWPNAAIPRSRSCPSRLKVFAGASSSYEEGIDFVAKVTKLLVIGLGSGTVDSKGISEGTKDVLRFLSFATPYFNPSNLGSWTFTLGAFLHYAAYEICCRMGIAASMKCMKESQPALAEALCQVEPSLQVAAIPSHEVVTLMDAMLPLCQQALYSKNGHVGRAGEAAMLYLAQIDPPRVTPAFIDFSTRALDITAVNLAHQAPAALSALTRLLQPSLRTDPRILLARLPDVLPLTLAGIDSNDQNKTIRTLILYRSLTSWVPVGGSPKDWRNLKIDSDKDADDKWDGTKEMAKDLQGHFYDPTKSPEYVEAVNQLPETSLLKQGVASEEMDLNLLINEASSAMSDWVLEFLDRVFSLLRASGEREKAGKTASGVASRHSSADVQQARNFSRVLKESLVQTFASMDAEVHALAVKSVARFLSEETLPEACKDASFLCLAVSSARFKNGVVSSPGLDALMPVLMDDLEHNSNKTAIYRLRCLAGAVRSCGVAIMKHKGDIQKAIQFALASKDKQFFKTGCKLLRHTLSTLCESYSYASGTAPRSTETQGTILIGKSAQLHNDPIEWHIPNGDCIQFAWDLLNEHVLQAIAAIPMSKDGTDMSDGPGTDSSASIDLPSIRRCLRVIRYALRGGAGILLEIDTGDDEHKAEGGGSMDADGESDALDTSLFPYEKAIQKILKNAPEETYLSILRMRGRLCYFIVSLINLIASETFDIKDLPSDFGGEERDGPAPDRKYHGLLSADSKICKEASDVSLLLLTRRGSAFRSQEGKTIWKAQKQLATDFALLAEADHFAESLQRANLYGDSRIVYFKDGDDGGKTLPRRLLVARIQLFHDGLQRTASFEVPKRLRRLSKARKAARNVLFSKDSSVVDLRETVSNITTYDPPMALDCYEGMIDGLCALSCHSNTQVRASAIGVIDYAITRYGWLLRLRVPRLLAAVNLQDDNMHGKFGIPSTALLKHDVDSKGKRKRLAEAMKGVCSILAIPRAGKLMMETEKARFDFVTTICGPQDLVSLMPAEEMQKMVHYLHSIFSPFRLKFYSLPRATKSESDSHTENLIFLLDILSTDKETTVSEEGDEKAAHWRKLLHACWFLTVLVDDGDLEGTDNVIATRLWKLCFQILEDEYGQPLQRVALGLFGRLLMIIKDGSRLELLRGKIRTESFCRIFGKALVYDHREDASVGGGHDAQWATGVADMIRDSARNIAPKSLFPFQRTNQSSGTFKVSHAQMVACILTGLGESDAMMASRYLLAFCKEMAASPPSEDQRNQQVTSAEIVSGITRGALLILSSENLSSFWANDLLPYFDEVIPKIPISLSGAYFDCLRFAIQLLPPNKFYPLTSWLFEKIEESLWRPGSGQETSEEPAPVPAGEDTGDASGKNGPPPQGAEGFTAQSKWLFLCSALLVELDETELDQTISKIPWYTKGLALTTDVMDTDMDTDSLKESWTLVSDKLLPRLTEALGHPYESCRDHISGCLFRICFCHRKMAIGTNSSGPSRCNSAIDLKSLDQHDPGAIIVKKLLSLENETYASFKDRYNSLITARRFFSYCIHFGETKFEFSDYMIPLLPVAFEALKSSVEDEADSTEPDTVAKRALEADVVKGFRYTISEVSTACVVSYGGSKGDDDISRVLATMELMSKHDTWQVRHAVANFSRCFQGSHKFLFSDSQAEKITKIVSSLLSDERREVSSAAMAAVTGIIAALPSETVSTLVDKYIVEANRSKVKGKKKGKKSGATAAVAAAEDEKLSEVEVEAKKAKEQKRARMQQSSVFFLCATILSQPYDTPAYVPKALATISKHSFERNAPLGIRDTVKRCCAEYKKMHMSDNWEVHRKMFTQEEMEALEDVVSTPHYYA